MYIETATTSLQQTVQNTGHRLTQSKQGICGSIGRENSTHDVGWEARIKLVTYTQIYNLSTQQ